MLKRVDEAEKRYRRDADHGDPIAQFKLGHAYYMEREETGDYDEALTLIRKAAAQDYDVALSHLGYMHLAGRGVALDRAKARSCFRRAAEQGDAGLQSNYGTQCWNGDFGSRDIDEAEIWWSKAAEQGDVHAHLNLGMLFADPWHRQAPRDVVQGYMWYTLAALQDVPGHCPGAARSARDHHADSMTAEQIAEAEARIEAWLASHREAMGEDLVANWHERIADPLKPRSPEEEAEAAARFHTNLAKIRKRFGRYYKDD